MSQSEFEVTRMQIAWAIVDCVRSDIVRDIADGETRRRLLTEVYNQTLNEMLKNERENSKE